MLVNETIKGEYNFVQIIESFLSLSIQQDLQNAVPNKQRRHLKPSIVSATCTSTGCLRVRTDNKL